MAMAVRHLSSLLLVTTLATLGQLPTPGNAFVKKLLEAKLMASMMKELNNQQTYPPNVYVPYSVPQPKLPPPMDSVDPEGTGMSMPLMARMKIMKSAMKTPMDMSQLENIAQHYGTAHFDQHFDHHHHHQQPHSYHEDPDESGHLDDHHIEDLHHFDGHHHPSHAHHHDLAHFDLSDHDTHNPLLLRNNLHRQATTIKLGSLKPRPWSVPSRGLMTTSLDLAEDFPMAGIRPMNSGQGMTTLNGGIDHLGESPFSMKMMRVPTAIEVNTDAPRSGMKNLNTLVEKMKELNSNVDLSDVSEEQMKRLIEQTMEKSSEKNEHPEENNNEHLDEMKPEDMDQLNIMKPFDMVKVSKGGTRLPAKATGKVKTNGKMELVAQPETPVDQDNPGSSYVPSGPTAMGMTLPRYPKPVPPVQFTMSLPSSPSRGNEAGQSLVGRMRTAMGSLGLGSTRKGNWNQLTANMAKLHEMSQATTGQRFNIDGHKMTVRPLMMPNSPPVMMSMYNSMPMFSLGMHPAMEAMLLGGTAPYTAQKLRPHPKEGLPAYLGSIQQSSTRARSKQNAAEATRIPQHQQLRSQMDKIMDEVTRRPSRRQNPYIAGQVRTDMTKSRVSSGFNERTSTDPAFPDVVNLKRLQRDKMDVAENHIVGVSSVVTSKQELDSDSDTTTAMNVTGAI